MLSRRSNCLRRRGAANFSQRFHSALHKKRYRFLVSQRGNQFVGIVRFGDPLRGIVVAMRADRRTFEDFTPAMGTIERCHPAAIALLSSAC